MSWRLLRLACLAPSWLLSGCLYVAATGGFGPVLDPEVVATLVPGETTKAEVLARLGPPQEYVRPEILASLGDETTRVDGAIALGNRAQDAFTWQYDDLRGSGTFLVLYNRIQIYAESALLVVFFDEHEVVREVSLRQVEGAH
jgi:hypothetical protein